MLGLGIFLMYLRVHRCQHGGNKKERYQNPASTVVINETWYKCSPQNQVQMQRIPQSE